jgi:hypothetical protein
MQRARRVRRSLGRDHEEEGELGAGCGHPGLLWLFFAGMDGQVSPASHRGPTDPPPDQEMAEGRRTRGWEMVGDGKRNSARIGDHAPYTKGNFQFERTVVGWRERYTLLDLRRK